MHSNDTPQEDLENSEVSASEVPINHIMDINDSDSDFEDISSDDENNRDYQLLATQEGAENGGQQTVYYPHNYTVDWVDWEQYEQTLEENASNQSDSADDSTTNRSDAADSSQTTDSATRPTTESSIQRPTIALTDDRIDVIKTLMTGFTLPEDNIPVWAQELPEEQWRELLSRKLDANKVEDK